MGTKDLIRTHARARAKSPRVFSLQHPLDLREISAEGRNADETPENVVLHCGHVGFDEDPKRSSSLASRRVKSN
jgi:hypothetical protein